MRRLCARRSPMIDPSEQRSLTSDFARLILPDQLLALFPSAEAARAYVRAAVGSLMKEASELEPEGDERDHSRVIEQILSLSEPEQYEPVRHVAERFLERLRNAYVAVRVPSVSGVDPIIGARLAEKRFCDAAARILANCAMTHAMLQKKDSEFVSVQERITRGLLVSAHACGELVEAITDPKLRHKLYDEISSLMNKAVLVGNLDQRGNIPASRISRQTESARSAAARKAKKRRDPLVDEINRIRARFPKACGVRAVCRLVRSKRPEAFAALSARTLERYVRQAMADLRGP